MIPIGVFGGADTNSLDVVVSRTRAAADRGFSRIWFPQVPGVDTLTALAVAAREVPDIHIGTSVVPVQGRHPIPLAQQALTVAEAAGPGRLTLGVGVSHPPTSEGWYGIPYSQVVSLCEETLQALGPLLSSDRRADVTGTHLTARVTLGTTGPTPGLLVAALGPRMLGIAGRLTDGTVTWMTGVKTIAENVAPRIRDAAAQAGRPEPRIVVGLPVCVTDDRAGAHARASKIMGPTAQHPSYRRMLAAEGASDPADIALIGTADEVRRRIDALARAGATEYIAIVQGTPEEREATLAALAGFSAGG